MRRMRVSWVLVSGLIGCAGGEGAPADPPARPATVDARTPDATGGGGGLAADAGPRGADDARVAQPATDAGPITDVGSMAMAQPADPQPTRWPRHVRAIVAEDGTIVPIYDVTDPEHASGKIGFSIEDETV